MTYHFKIIFLMIKSTKNWPIVLFSKKVVLNNGLIFNIRNFMDWYVIIETVILNCYHFDQKQTQVIDIGAAIGDFSIFASSKSNQVYAIEPEPSSYKLLQQNISQNKIKNIACFPIALHSSKNFLKLSINNSNHGNTNTFSVNNLITVPATSLTEFIKLHTNHSPLYIKCDCEGGEYDIFNTLPTSIFSRIKQISMEYHLFTKDHTKQFTILQKTLTKNNFQLKIISNPVHQSIGFLEATKIVL